MDFINSYIRTINKKIIKKNNDGIKLLNLAIYDMIIGFNKMTSISAEKKLKEIQKYNDTRNMFNIIISIMKQSLYCIIYYKTIKDSYIDFREKILNISFWKRYLNNKD